jgi:hypothetical protein
MAKFYFRTMERILKSSVLLGVACLILFACKIHRPITLEENFRGNWWYCDPELDYTELYVINDTLLMFNDRVVGSTVSTYAVTRKKIVLIHPVKITFEINETTSDKMTFINETGSRFTIYRLFEEINLDDLNSRNDDNFNQFGAAFVKRAEKCMD